MPPPCRLYQDLIERLRTQTVAHLKNSTISPCRSLHLDLTWVYAPLLCSPVHPLKVTKAWGTPKLCLPKVHMSGEEEFSMPWPYTTLQQRRDTAQPVATALGSWLKDPALLPVEPAHPQGDDGSLLLWHMGDILDEALDNCRGRRQRSADLKGTVNSGRHT